ncbi:MAG TPA: DUF4249 domain-containing protein [Puia sp.]
MKCCYIKRVLPLFGLFAHSCTKVIQVNLNDASPQIVIEGIINNRPGPYRVQIIRTVNFSDANVYPAVSGAIVKITDSTSGITDILTETSAGIYSTQILPQGMPGHTYQLYVSVSGQTFTATSAMPQPVLLDSVTFQDNNRFGTDNINAIANFQDPPGTKNYYTFTEYVNNKQLNRIFASDDRLSNGKYIRQQFFNDSSYLRPGDNFVLEMNCVDQRVWNYFNTLEQVTNGNSFQSAAPSNPVTNIDNNALGYFMASTVNSIDTTVK